jgi:hypothetical protein
MTGLPMNRGVKNSPETVKAGSLALHPNKREQNTPLRTLTKFTNSPIYQEIYKHKNLGLKFYAHTQISEGHIFTG